MTTVTDYGDLSTTALVKLINDEYASILADERTYLQKALSLGEKLIALRPRIAPKHGDWQRELAKQCPGIKYEKANLCIRFVENLDKLEAYAASKSVKITDLGVDEARKALTTPKNQDKPNDTSKGKSASVVKAAVEPATQPTPRTVAPDVALEGLANDEVFDTLQNVYENRRQELLELVKKLAGSFGMVLVLENTSAALEKLTPTPTATTGFERRI
jgi:hypothetical protein